MQRAWKGFCSLDLGVFPTPPRLQREPFLLSPKPSRKPVCPCQTLSRTHQQRSPVAQGSLGRAPGRDGVALAGFGHFAGRLPVPRAAERPGQVSERLRCSSWAAASPAQAAVAVCGPNLTWCLTPSWAQAGVPLAWQLALVRGTCLHAGHGWRNAAALGALELAGFLMLGASPLVAAPSPPRPALPCNPPQRSPPSSH